MTLSLLCLFFHPIFKNFPEVIDPVFPKFGLPVMAKYYQNIFSSSNSKEIDIMLVDRL